jgi:hypothetical protein
MAASNFSLDDLSGNPHFDFIQSLKNNSNNHENAFVFDLFDPDDLDSPYLSTNFNCNYFDTTSVCNKLSNDTRISVMSINIQSLSAKFNELQEFIDMFPNFESCPDVILLQEIWNVLNSNCFPLINYQPLIFKCRANGQGGGVGI